MLYFFYFQVADRVKEMKTEDENCYVQISEKTDTLTKKVYLLPSSQYCSAIRKYNILKQ